MNKNNENEWNEMLRLGLLRIHFEFKRPIEMQQEQQ